MPHPRHDPLSMMLPHTAVHTIEYLYATEKKLYLYYMYSCIPLQLHYSFTNTIFYKFIIFLEILGFSGSITLINHNKSDYYLKVNISFNTDLFYYKLRELLKVNFN